MSSIIIELDEQKRLLERNRTWIADQLGIPPSVIPNGGVENVKQWVPEPLFWKNRMRLVIPAAELGYQRMWQTLSQVAWFGWHMDHGRFASAIGPYIADTHNSAVRESLKYDDWDYLVFLEHDHGFKPNLLQRIGLDYTQPVVGGLYFNRIPEEPAPVAYKWNEARQSLRRLQPYEVGPMLEKPGFYEVDVVPMGQTAIRRDVLENWKPGVPFFANPTSPHNGSVMSDDVWFCRMAQDLGYVITLDTKVIPKHYGLVGFDERHYVGWCKVMLQEGKAKKVEEVEAVWEDQVP